MAANKQLVLCLCTVSAFATACADSSLSKPVEENAAVDPASGSTVTVADITTSGDQHVHAVPTTDGQHVHVVPATEETKLQLGVASYKITTQDSGDIFVRALDASGHEFGTLAIAQVENGQILLAVQSGASSLELTLSNHDKAVVTSARLDGRDISMDELMSGERAAPVSGATVRGDAVRVFSRFDEDRQHVSDTREYGAAGAYETGDESGEESGPCLACVASALSTIGAGATCTGVVLACIAGSVVTIGGTVVPCAIAIPITCGAATGAILAAINSCSSCLNPTCVPSTCATWSFRVCGPQNDGCNNTINCDCTPGNVCNSSSHLCVPACVPQTCAAHSGQCGTFNDGCGGSITCGSYDACGVCNGDGSSCACPWYDACGVCEGDGSSCAGCDGQPNSGLVYDACGVCGGDDSSCAGCDGIPWSGASYDACGVCGGDGSSCAGCAWYDACGVCEGDGSSCSGGDGGDGGDGGGGGGGGGSLCDELYGDWSWDDCYMDDGCWDICVVWQI